MMRAKIQEIFRSIQGEGIYHGARQIFIRFYGCNLECKFCDTPQEKFKYYTPDQLLKEVESFKDPYHSVSLTGGEPLLQKDFLKVFLPRFKKDYIKIYLDTNGVCADALSEIIEYLDIIAMDFKLPSSTHYKALWTEHRKFLKVATQKDVFVKVVVCYDTIDEEIYKTAYEIKEVDANIPLVLQPEGSQMQDEDFLDRLDELRANLKNYLKDVRIVPQMHKLLGVQ